MRVYIIKAKKGRHKMRCRTFFWLFLSLLVMVEISSARIIHDDSAFVNRHSPRRNAPQQALHAIRATIRMVGRKADDWLEDGCAVYVKRMQQQVEVQTEIYKNNDALLKAVNTDTDKNTPVILLDPNAKQCTSDVFCQKFYNWAEQGGSRLTFVIGGAEGLPDELQMANSSGKMHYLGLSKMTLTHQFARLVLVEQIYRAFEIRKGSGYHK